MSGREREREGDSRKLATREILSYLLDRLLADVVERRGKEDWPASADITGGQANATKQVNKARI